MAATRQMTREERAGLEARLARLDEDRMGLWGFIGVLAAGTLGLTLLGLLAWVAAVFLAGIFTGLTWRDHLPSSGAVVLLAVAALAVTLAQVAPSWRRSVRLRRAQEAALRADLAAGLVQEESLAITGVKRFRDPEHGVKYYLLRVADGRVRVLCDFAGTGLVEGRGEKALGPRLGERMTMIVHPASSEARYSFDGPALRLPRFHEMTAPPERWPEQDSWCEIAWDEIEAALAGTAARST